MKTWDCWGKLTLVASGTGTLDKRSGSIQAANFEMLQVPWVLGNIGEERKPTGMVRRRRIVGISVLHHSSVKSICD